MLLFCEYRINNRHIYFLFYLRMRNKEFKNIDYEMDWKVETALKRAVNF